MSDLAAVDAYPLAPSVQLPWRQRVRLVKNFHTSPAEIRDSVGPVALVKLGPARIAPLIAMVSSPQGARDVLGATEQAIDKTGVAHRQSRLWGDNLFTVANETWLPRRRVLQPLFTKKHVASFAEPMSRVAHEMASNWAADERVSLNAECRRLTLSVLGRSVLGMDLGQHSVHLAPHVERVLNYVARRITKPVRAPAGLPTLARERFRRSLKEIQTVVDEAVGLTRNDPDHDAPLVRLLINTRDIVSGASLSARTIRDELVIFILAGHDTTATTLTYALWAVGKRPELQYRIAREAADLGERALTVDDVSQLSYSAQVIKEAMRLCPPAPVVARHCTADTIVDGHRIPAGADIFVSVYALQRDPALWNEPERFDPDRFSPDQTKGRNRWQYLPFGGGPRSCIGDHFATLEATLALATLIRELEITSEEDEFPIALSFTVIAGGEIPATARARSDRSVRSVLNQ